MMLSMSRVTVATDDLVVYYLNTLIEIYNVDMFSMYGAVLAAVRRIPYLMFMDPCIVI